MSAITAKQVQELRQATGAGMMDAKKALTAAEGDFEAAVQALREKGLAKAAGRTDRENTEGLISIAENDEAAALVQLKSETDFAAKSDDFKSYASALTEAVLEKGSDAINEKKAELEDLQLVIKENIEVGVAEKASRLDVRVAGRPVHEQVAHVMAGSRQ